VWSTVRDGARGSSPGWRPAGSAWIVGLLLLLAACRALAVGTPAGTSIGNSATLTFQLAGQTGTATAHAPAVIVARLVNVGVTWQDAAPPAARSPESARALAFVVTNTGNGPETYRLARDDKVGGDQFDPTPASVGGLWLESGAQPGFQASGPNADIQYIPGVNDPVLPADGSRTVYVVSDIPAGVADAAAGRIALTATATTAGAPGAAPGTLIGQTGGVQVVAGPATQASATGWYLVAGVSMGLAKSVVQVRDPQGGSRVMPGTVLTYRIVLTFVGSGVASGVTFSDPLPDSLRYVPGSLLVDGSARTDAADGDAAGVAGNTVSADFGSVTAPAQRVIEFKATVN
jgi:uncharacterized repeat protein (TIGR01451 family)